MIDDGLAVIMAGGDSRRMGSDKASLVLGEQTLLQRVAEVMQKMKDPSYINKSVVDLVADRLMDVYGI